MSRTIALHQQKVRGTPRSLLILVAQFNNFYQTLLILSAVILSTIGVLLGLLITQQPFGIVRCGIGIIALAGIVVNNNIVLIDTFNILRAEGLSGITHLRPTLTSSVNNDHFRIDADGISDEYRFSHAPNQFWCAIDTVVDAVSDCGRISVCNAVDFGIDALFVGFGG
jgi:multidrug efflux pump